IQYRVTDTLIGAGLATLGNLLLWPAWEIQGMQKTLLETIKANRVYLEEIIGYYNKKENISSEYKVARKKAFLEMSELSSAFQRMTQEPKSKQKNLDKFYEIAMLNHTVISSLSSLSNYILNNLIIPDTENFNKVSSKIVENLLEAESVLKEEISSEIETNELDSENIFETTFGKKIIYYENEKPREEDYHSKIEEAHLVREQLKWLLRSEEHT